jgi:hypothetical protein
MLPLKESGAMSIFNLFFIWEPRLLVFGFILSRADEKGNSETKKTPFKL